MPELNRRQFEQPELFDRGPESPVMWHSSHRPSESSDWDTDRVGVTHAGSQRAALERNYGKQLAYTTNDPRTMYSLRVDGEKMHNTPQDPVSDAMGNSIFGQFTETPSLESIVPSRDDLDRFIHETNVSPHDQTYAEAIITERDTLGPGEVNRGGLGVVQPRKGVFYTNEAEDIGSVSASAPASAYTPLARFEVRKAAFDVEHPEKMATVGPVQEPDKSYPTSYIHEQPRLFDISPYDQGELPRREFRHGDPQTRRVG